MSARGVFTATQAFSSRRTVTSNSLEDMHEAIDVLNSNAPIHVSTTPVQGRPGEYEGEHGSVVLWCHPTCVTVTQEQQEAAELAEVIEEERQEVDLKRMHEENRLARRRAVNARAQTAAAKVTMKTDEDEEAINFVDEQAAGTSQVRNKRNKEEEQQPEGHNSRKKRKQGQVVAKGSPKRKEEVHVTFAETREDSQTIHADILGIAQNILKKTGRQVEVIPMGPSVNPKKAPDGTTNKDITKKGLDGFEDARPKQ